MQRNQLAAMVDHTLLKAESQQGDIEEHCMQAHDMGCFSVCVNPRWVEAATVALGSLGSATRVCSVVGFPLGASHREAKYAEAYQAVADGATEIDMVMSIGDALDGNWDNVCVDIARVRLAAAGAELKVIIESALLDESQIRQACRTSLKGGADWVKTSTGMHAAGGASVDAVKIMADEVAGQAGVKASGGIRSLADAQAMIEAGAGRLGLSSTAQVLGEISE